LRKFSFFLKKKCVYTRFYSLKQIFFVILQRFCNYANKNEKDIQNKMFRNIPIVTRWLLIINVVAYFLLPEFSSTGKEIVSSYLWPIGGGSILATNGTPVFFDFQPHQLFTHMFLHGNFYHLLFNMFALWFFGCDVERQWGEKKFIFYYLFCGLGAAASQLLLSYVTSSGSPMLGASGAIFGVLLAYAVLFPNRRIGILALPVGIIIASALLPNNPALNLANQIVTYVFIFLIIAMAMPGSGLSRWFARNIKYMLPVYLQAKWIVAGYIAIELFFMYIQMEGDNISHIAHLGGVLFGLIPILFWEWQRRQSVRPRKNTTTFDATGAQTRRETDAEYNMRKRARQEEVDKILDKIRKSGYDSLTKAEKQRLFEASREK